MIGQSNFSFKGKNVVFEIVTVSNSFSVCI